MDFDKNSKDGLFEEMSLAEKQLDSTNVYDGKLLHVFKDNIELPGGKKSTREYIKHLGAVAIVALDEKGRIAIEHQYRYPFHTDLVEIPAGKLDYAGEDLLEAAERELREETGIVARKLEYLGPLYPTVAYSTEIIHLYLATGLSFGERELDEDENINIEMIDLQKAVSMVLEGRIPDAKSQAAILNVWVRLNGKS